MWNKFFGFSDVSSTLVNYKYTYRYLDEFYKWKKIVRTKDTQINIWDSDMIFVKSIKPLRTYSNLIFYKNSTYLANATKSKY